MVSILGESSHSFLVDPDNMRKHPSTFQPINTSLEDDHEETTTSSRRFKQTIFSSDEDQNLDEPLDSNQVGASSEKNEEFVHLVDFAE